MNKIFTHKQKEFPKAQGEFLSIQGALSSVKPPYLLNGKFERYASLQPIFQGENALSSFRVKVRAIKVHQNLSDGLEENPGVVKSEIELLTWRKPMF